MPTPARDGSVRAEEDRSHLSQNLPDRISSARSSTGSSTPARPRILHLLARARRSALHRHPGLSVPHLPPLGDLSGGRRARAAGPQGPRGGRALRLWPRRGDLGARDHGRRIWRADRQRDLSCRPAGGADGPRLRALRPAALYPRREASPRPDARCDARLGRARRALYSAIAPPSFARPGGGVRRLFERYEEVERDYYRKTGIFPIMHTVVVRRDLYKKIRGSCSRSTPP